MSEKIRVFALLLIPPSLHSLKKIMKERKSVQIIKVSLTLALLSATSTEEQAKKNKVGPKVVKKNLIHEGKMKIIVKRK